MTLYHFAHKKEASAFLDFSSAQKLAIPVGQLYQSELGFILISGEGIFKTLESMTNCLTLYPQINRIINLGVAGSLDNTLKIQEIVRIRTVYAELSGQPEYHSFCAGGTIDCVTTNQRILSEQDLQKISYLANIVDRELWAVARIAKNFNIPFQSYKLISDYAGANVDCFNIIEQAENYSQKLFDYILENQEININTTDEYILPPDFYFTKSLKNQFLNLVSKIKLKEIDLEKIKAQVESQKERTQILIAEMEKIANPIESITKNRLSQLVSPLNKIGAEVHFDPKLEKENFKITMDINSDKNIKNLAKALNELSFEKINKTLNGEFDV